MTWITDAFSFLCKGGPVMVPLMICSVISVAVMLERYAYLKKAGGDSAKLMGRVEKSILLGKFTDAVESCRKDGTMLGEMLAGGLNCHEAAQSERCMEEHALKAMPELYRRLNVLDTIVTIAPLLGLLGTVTGMIRAFHVIASKSGLSTPTAITGGVAEALIATATGLAIAIITLIGYNYLTERAKLIISDLEINGTRLVNILSNGAEESHEAKAMGA
jgi:biopolymer transport protein ExbB